MKTKIFACVLVVAMIFSSISVFAVSFSDVADHWAQKEIEELASKKIINGYDETSFGPEDPVKRVDALLLASRSIGSIDAEREAYINASNDKYYSKLMALGYKGYEKTLSFLIYNDLYTFEEIRDFVNNQKGEQNLKRVEMAEIIVKILDKTDEIKDISTKLPFTDVEGISLKQKRYIAFCYNEGFMKGMDNSSFAPDETVTRAQMATILHRIINGNKAVYSYGQITEVNSINNSVKYTEPDGTKKTLQGLERFKLKLNAETITKIDSLKIGDSINVIYKNDTLTLIEFLSDNEDIKVQGIYEGAMVSSSGQKIQLKSESDGVSHTYELDTKCEVMVNGAKKTVSAINAGDYITITLTSDKVTKIVSENVRETIKGFISKIVISATPEITVNYNNTQGDFAFTSSGATITLDGEKADVYDIRLGYEVEINLFNSKVENMKITSKVIEEITDYVSGTVKYVDTNYKYIIIVNDKNEEKQIFFNNNTKIKDAEGNAVEMSDKLLGASVKLLYTSDNYSNVADEIILK